VFEEEKTLESILEIQSVLVISVKPEVIILRIVIYLNN